MNCDACGKDFERREDESLGEYRIIGISIEIGGTNTTTDVDIKYLSRQMGPYELGTTYSVCYECWLRSLGVKPPTKEIEVTETEAIEEE
jgi:hypothetical protein